MPAGAATRDISSIVWIGCLGLLFLAVAVHEGWFSGSSAPMITSGTAADGGGSTGTYNGGVYNDPTYGALPNWGL